MAKIIVDHSRLIKTANDIDSYIDKHKSNMNSINLNIVSLNNTWQGKDYNQLKFEWEQMKANDSTSAKMIASLENYSSFLRFAAKKYMDAQTAAVNRANLLPR